MVDKRLYTFMKLMVVALVGLLKEIKSFWAGFEDIFCVLLLIKGQGATPSIFMI